MKQLRTLVFLPLLLCATHVTEVFAQDNGNDQELEELLGLDISDLVGMEVSVASKKMESLREAPGVISIITAEEIERFGARHLRDVLDRVANTQVLGSAFFPHNAVSIRAGSTTHVDNHSLLLLNGRPIRESHAGGINLDIYANFPVSMVERIEIIRGPGSVLYGSNAYTGVVNIITKKRKEEGVEGSANVRYGSFDSKSVEATTSVNEGDLLFNIAAQSQDSDGWDYTLTDEFGVGDSTDWASRGTQMVINSEFSGFELNGIIGNWFQDQIATPVRWPKDELQISRQYIDGGYTHEITDDWDVSLNFTYNGQNFDPRLKNTDASRKSGGRSKGQLYELASRKSITEDIDVVAGAVYDRLDGKLRSTGNSYDTGRYSFYTQGDYQISDSIKLIAGVQWNKPDGISGDLSPRGGAIIDIDDNWGLKLLYGQAFLSAYGSQQFTNSSGFAGNSELAPEEIETYDAQLFYSNSSTYAGITFYYSEMTETHTRELLPTGQATTVNSGSIDFHGIEVEGKTELLENLYFTANVSYQESEDDMDREDVTYSPNWMAKAGFSYEHDSGVTLSLFDSFFDTPTAVSEFRPDVPELNDRAESYHLLTGNLIIDVDQILADTDLMGLKLSLYVDNILDEDIRYPSFTRPSLDTLPHHEGRGYYGRLSVEF